ncbi:DUF4143 domain-containing protein [Eggerthella lenta]|nr:DUF4143 domain-containing protein [Eggerthella lenta]
MHRTAMRNLLSWKASPRRKPLIVNGARQVGKTWLIKEFGKQHFKTVAYINFDNNQRMPHAFEGALSPERLIPMLEAESSVEIDPSTTLIVLDEIQEVPRALKSLKYFYEEAPECHVIAAGSSLGIALHNNSFPVGKVSFLDLHPLSFSEFLLALGRAPLANLVEKLDWESVKPFHDELIELTRMYMFVGGMPEVVSAFASSRSFSEARTIQNELLESYELDFSKHADASMAEKLRLIWKSIPSNLCRENKKFVFKRIRESARAREFEEGLEWLEDASLIQKVKRINTPGLPLASYQDDEAFKVFGLDVGLMGAMCGLRAQAILEGDAIFREFKGALGEQLALQEYVAKTSKPIWYFQNEQTRTEIDFIFDGLENVRGVVPMEVKYGTNLKAKSLASFAKKHEPELALRISAAPRSQDGVIANIPYYALGSAFASLMEEQPLKERPEIAEKREALKPGSSERLDSIFLRYLEGHPASKKELVSLHNLRENVVIDTSEAEKALARLKAKNAIESKGSGRGAYWAISGKPENEYRLYEGEGSPTPFAATSKIGLLETMEENWGKVAELLPFDYFCLDDRDDWRDFVDDLMVPDVPEDPDSALDIVKKSGIPRELEPGRYVLNVQGHPDSKGPEDEFFLIDIEDDLDSLNAILQRIFPDYGYSIRKGLPDL